jgi:hypothetical protein
MLQVGQFEGRARRSVFGMCRKRRCLEFGDTAILSHIHLGIDKREVVFKVTRSSGQSKGVPGLGKKWRIEEECLLEGSFSLGCVWEDSWSL